MNIDPRALRLIELYARAKGDARLRKIRTNPTPSGEVLAGWALERSAADPLRAMALIRGIKMPRWQRDEALSELESLTTSFDLTRPIRLTRDQIERREAIRRQHEARARRV
jgi:hypothetical protein